MIADAGKDCGNGCLFSLFLKWDIPPALFSCDMVHMCGRETCMKISATLRILVTGKPQRSFPNWVFECNDVAEGGLDLACTGSGGSCRMCSAAAPHCLCRETPHVQPSSRAPAWWGEPALHHWAISNPLVFVTEGRRISFEQSCTDGQRCFAFDVTLANWKAFPKLRVMKSVMLTGVGVCHCGDQLWLSSDYYRCSLKWSHLFWMHCPPPLYPGRKTWDWVQSWAGGGLVLVCHFTCSGPAGPGLAQS